VTLYKKTWFVYWVKRAGRIKRTGGVFWPQLKLHFFFASFLNQNSVAILTDLAMKLTCCPTSHYLVIQAETDILHSNLTLLFNFVSFWS